MKEKNNNKFWLYCCAKCNKDICRFDEVIEIQHFNYKVNTKRSYFCRKCFVELFGEEFLLQETTHD